MFAQKKNKKFNYQSRISKEENSASRLKESLNSSWGNERRMSSNSNKGSRLFLLIGVLVVIGIVMYYLETKIN